MKLIISLKIAIRCFIHGYRFARKVNADVGDKLTINMTFYITDK